MTADAGPPQIPTTLSTELSGLELEQLVGTLVSALVRAQGLSVEETMRFIRELGFQAGPDGALEARTLEFQFSRSELIPGTDEVRESQVTVTVPLLSMVAIPTLAVKHAVVDLDVNLQTYRAIETASDGPATGMLGVPASMRMVRSLKTATPPSPTGGRKVSEEAQVHVTVKFRQAEAPLGIQRLLGLLDRAHREQSRPLVPSPTPPNEEYPMLNVKDFGAVGDGRTDDTAALRSALDAVPASGGIVFFPSGTYLTTGIVITDEKLVTLQGEGGSLDVLSPGHPATGGDDMLHSGSVIRSVTNAPIVTFATVRPHGVFGPGRHAVGLRSLVVQGSGRAKASELNNQHGVQVDNGGIVTHDVTIAHCGGHGLLLTQSDVSVFYNLRTQFNNGDGIQVDGPVGTNIFGAMSVGNGRDGLRLQRGGGGTSTFGLVVEQNAGYGINLLGHGPDQYVRFCRFMSTWDEGNAAGSVYFSENAFNNVVDFVRYSSGVPEHQFWADRNLVWGNNLGAPTAAAGAIKHRFFQLQSAGGLSSADEDHLRVRDRNDTGDGVVLAAHFSASAGLADSDIYPSDKLPILGAFNVANNRGLVSARAARPANLPDGAGTYDLIASNPVDGVDIGRGSTGPTNVHSDLVVQGSITKTGGGEYVVQSDPDDPGTEFVYSALIGGEVGTYLRGTAELVFGEATIELPHHFAAVTNPNGITVQLTPRGAWLQLYVVEAGRALLRVREANGHDGEFDYIVQGIREGFVGHSVVHVVPKG